MKKKTKRVDTSKAIGSEKANRFHYFCDIGAPVALVMLFLFVVLCSIVIALTVSPQGSPTPVTIAFSSFLRIFPVVLLSCSAIGLYVARYSLKILNEPLKCVGLLFIMLGVIVFNQFGILFVQSKFEFIWSPYFIVMPLMVAAISVTIALTQRFALGIGAFLCVLSVIALKENNSDFGQVLSVLMVTGCGMGISILSLKKIRTRTKLIKVCAIAGVVVFMMVWAMGIWQKLPMNEIMKDACIGLVGALLVGILIQGFLPYIERIFRVATDMTLLDYSDSSLPLLSRLAVEVPGTYNHSFQIGMMAEAAAEEIGANGLLCRVGAYYHDIGKINKPHFFVENQGESFNQHRDLSPTMSKMIIIGHVKDGLEMAHEYRIPKVLHQFIASHHGTTLVEYFYHQAMQQVKEAGHGTINETEFRYPGPKPHSKETAIVMLCDCVESATRALKDPTPSRIEDIVNQLSMNRLLDGQFDECDLTMRELHIIENRIVKTLCGMYHGRIAYPKLENKKENDSQTNDNHSEDRPNEGNTNQSPQTTTPASNVP